MQRVLGVPGPPTPDVERLRSRIEFRRVVGTREPNLATVACTWTAGEAQGGRGRLVLVQRQADAGTRGGGGRWALVTLVAPKAGEGEGFARGGPRTAGRPRRE